MKQSIKSQIGIHFKENLSIYVFTSVLFLIGIIFGAIIVNSLNYTQKQDLFVYLSKFFGQVSDGQLASASVMFKQSFFHYVKYFGLIWILGLSVIGLPIILILIFLKGIVVGFTVGFLVNQMGWYGFMLSFVSVMPQNLVLIPAFIVVGTTAIAFSIKMIRHQFVKKAYQPIAPMFLKYTLVFILAGGAVSLSAGLEAYLSPVMMKGVLNHIYK